MIPRRIGVVTPVGPASAQLARAVSSVAAQSFPNVLHVVVFDGHQPKEWDARVQAIVLPRSCQDTGATPRAIGACFAIAQQCDGLAFLDADNSWDPEHLESLARLADRFEVTVAGRRICTDEDVFLFNDDRESNGDSFADTNCFLLTGRAIHVAREWGDVPRTPGVCTAGVDRVIWDRIRRRGFGIANTGKFTVTYRSRWLAHYAGRPELRPARCKVMDTVNGVPTAKWV